MNYEAIIVGVITGLITGLLTSSVVAWWFYRLGRTDTEAAYRRFILTMVDMRLRQMIPTRRQNTPEHYDLRDTEHWLTCLSEVLGKIGFMEDSTVVKALLKDLSQAPVYTNPNKQQVAQGETDKIRWEEIIHKRIEALK